MSGLWAAIKKSRDAGTINSDDTVSCVKMLLKKQKYKGFKVILYLYFIYFNFLKVFNKL